jgi:hypothetical protein
MSEEKQWDVNKINEEITAFKEEFKEELKNEKLTPEDRMILWKQRTLIYNPVDISKQNIENDKIKSRISYDHNKYLELKEKRLKELNL